MAERIVELRKELASNPASRQFYQLGELLRRQGEAAEAATVLRQGLEHHPRYVAAWVSLGRALVDLQDGDGAGVALERALELDPGNPVAWRLIGESRLLCGDRDGALVAMERALALVPGDEILEAAVRTLRGDEETPDTGSGPSDEVAPAGETTASEDAKELERPDVSAAGAGEGFKELEDVAVASQVPAVAAPGEEGVEAPGEAPAPVMKEAQAAAASTREQDAAQPSEPFGDAAEAEAAVLPVEDPFRATDERPEGDGDPFGADVFEGLPEPGHFAAMWDVFGPPPGAEPGMAATTQREASHEFPAAPPPGDLEITVTVPPPVPADWEEVEQEPFAAAPRELEPDAAYHAIEEELPAEQTAGPIFSLEEVDEIPHEYPFAMPEEGEAILLQQGDESAGWSGNGELAAEESVVPPVGMETGSQAEEIPAAPDLIVEGGPEREAAEPEVAAAQAHPTPKDEEAAVPLAVGAPEGLDPSPEEGQLIDGEPTGMDSGGEFPGEEAPREFLAGPSEFASQPPSSEASPAPEDVHNDPAEIEPAPMTAAVSPPTMAFARALIQQQQLDQALAVLNEMIVNDPTDQEARDLRSLVLDMMEPLDAPLPRLSLRERRIAALQHWLASITINRDRTLS